ncbi:MAG: hypothetical protein RIA10_01300, partial [Amphiplicatus sp.]
MMRFSGIRVFAATLIAAFSYTLGFAPARANEPSIPSIPSHTSIDGNGVDVITGAFYPSWPSISIGTEGSAPLVFTRRGRTDYHDSLYGGINASGSAYTVTLMGASSEWTYSGGTFAPAEGQGGTLTYDSGTNDYTYTTPSGAVAIFDGDVTTSIPVQANKGRIVSLAYPTGETLTFNYEYDLWCIEKLSGECISEVPMRRPTSVSSSLGYRIDYTYSSTAECCNAAWYRPIGAKAIDVSNGGSPVWQSLSFSGAQTQTVTDALGRVYTYTKDSNENITGIKLPGSSSNDVTIAYTNGRVSSITKFGGTWTYQYLDDGWARTTTITDPLNHARVIISNTSTNRVTSDMDALNKVTSYEYDASKRLKKITAPEGNYTEYAYDSRGNLTSVTATPKSGSGLSPITTFQASYPATCSNPKTCNQPTWTKDALGRQTDYTYNTTHGGLLTVQAPSPGAGIARPQTTYTYSSLGAYSGSVWRLTSITACSLTTVSTCAGNAAETKTVIAYTADDRLPSSITVQSGDGSVVSTTTISYTYQRLVDYTDGPLSGTVDRERFIRNVNGEVIGHITPDPDGSGPLKFRAVRTTFNSRGLPATVERGTTNSFAIDFITFSALQTQANEYDAYGRLAKASFSAGGATHSVAQYSYDGDSRPECTAFRMNPSVFGSLPSSACTGATAGAFGPDRISRTYYDAAGHAIKTTLAYGVSQAIDESQSTYTSNGLLATIKDASGNLTTYEYDGFDRLKKLRYPHPSTTGTSSTTDYEEWTYNAVGSVLTERRRDGQTITNGYDLLNRQTSRGGAPIADTSFAYDNLGRLVSATQSGTSLNVSYVYDALSRLLSETAPQGTVSYQYDVAGRNTRVTYPGSFYVDYDYDNSGAMTKVRENGATSGVGVLATYAYDNLGRRTSLTRGNGVVTTYGFNTASQLSSLAHDLAGTAHDQTLTFSYNPASQITQRTSANALYDFAQANNIDLTAAFDGLNRLTAFDGAPVTH